MVVEKQDRSCEELSQITEYSSHIRDSLESNRTTNQLDLYSDLSDLASTKIPTIIEELYKDSERFFVFLSLVCKHVITKSKWKKYKESIPYYEFVTESDEAFAILIMDNNLIRYKDMINLGECKRDCWSQPKYTRMGSDRRTVGRGWSSEGKLKYFELTKAIQEWRDENNGKMMKLGSFVLKKYINMNKTKFEPHEKYMQRKKQIMESMMLSTVSVRKRKKQKTTIDFEEI